MPDLADVLATQPGSKYVVAPAGFGKTYLIAAAVSRGAHGRQLVLTHTYAGVGALRSKMRELRVPNAAFQIDTIASWALRLARAYSATSGWAAERPTDSEWARLYAVCSALLDRDFIRRIVRASYGGLYVDEYQDCSIGQHELVLRLARDLPCRVLGDPLQAIFDFDGQRVDWERDVAAAFERAGTLEIPQRWVRAGTPEIGAWLQRVRHSIETGQSISLDETVPNGVTIKRASSTNDLTRVQGNTCRYFRCDSQSTAIAIHEGSHQGKQKCHTLAKNVAGIFSSIEEIEGRALFSIVQKLERATTNQGRLKTVVAFAAQCMTSVNASLSAATKRGERTEVRSNTRNPAVAVAANAYLAEPSSATMLSLLLAVRALNAVEVVRADLLNRMTGVLRKHALNPSLLLREAAEKYHAEFRNRGRPVGRKLIGTTLLIKGLEFDHAIILDAESLSKRELYVALTRGSRSLTIVSSSPTLNPSD